MCVETFTRAGSATVVDPAHRNGVPTRRAERDVGC